MTPMTPDAEAALRAMMEDMLGRELPADEFARLAALLRAWCHKWGETLVLHGQPVFPEK